MKKVVTLIEASDYKLGPNHRRVFNVRFPEFAGLTYTVKQTKDGGLVFPSFKAKSGKRQEYVWWNSPDVNQWLTGYLSRYGESHSGGDFESRDYVNELPESAGWENIFPGASNSALATGTVTMTSKDGLTVKLRRTRVMQSNFFRKGVRRDPYVLLPGYSGEVKLAKVPRMVGIEMRKHLMAEARLSWEDKYGEELGIQREEAKRKI